MFFLQPNQKKLLNSLNPLLIVVYVFFLILLRTTLDPISPSIIRKTDILLPCVLYFGQRRGLFEGLVLSLFIGHLYSLSSSAPIGLFTTQYLLLFFVARIIAYGVYADRWYLVVALLFAMACLSRLLLVILASFFSHGWPLFSDPAGIFSWLFGTTVFGYLIFLGLVMVDRVSFKAPRESIEI